MKIKRPLAPDFINKWDARLLITKPSAWSTRAHLVLYYAGAFALLITAIGFLLPNDPRNDGNVFLWLSLLSVLSVIGIIIWIIYLLRFNVFKRFGVQKSGDGLKSFGLYFSAVALMTAIPFLPPAIESIRANMAYSNDEIVRDYNTISADIVKLEYDSIVHRWDRSTYQLHISDTVYNESEVISVSDSGGGFYYVSDTSSFRNKITTADSLKKINDTTYVIYDCPEYIFLHSYNLDTYSKLDQIISRDIYDNIIRNFQRPDREKVAAELKGLIDKYSLMVEKSNYYYGFENEDSYKGRVTSRYNLATVAHSLDNISQQKDRWKGNNWVLFLRFFYYITLVLSILVFIFRHTTVRVFFLSMLTAVLLAILTSLILASSGTDGLATFPLLFIYYGLFAVLAITGSTRKNRSAVGGIALNLFIFFTPYIFLLAVGWYYVVLHNKPYETVPENAFDNEGLHFVLAEIAGSVLFIILVEPVFKKLYRKWYSQPEE